MEEVALLRNCRVRSHIVQLATRTRNWAPFRYDSGKVQEMPLRHHKIYRYRSFSTESAGRHLREEPRVNPVGIQYLSESLHKQLFGNKKNSHKETFLSEKHKEALINLSKQSLKKFDLLGKKTVVSEPISFELPPLQGNSLDEHFQRLGHFASEPYRSMCVNKFTSIVARPSKWERQSGWMRYEPGRTPEKVRWPLEDTLVFDVETLYEISHFPTLAVALSDKAWYLWCSPFICGDDSFEHLIPMDTTNKSKLVIGHNVGYDRARVLEEYNFQASMAFFLDTQSLHVASSGLCSRQRPQFMKSKKSLGYDSDERVQNGTDLESDAGTLLNDLEEDPWLGVSAMNSLRDVAFLHCGISMNKQPRDLFSSRSKNVVIENFDELVNYCATDVETTSKVFDKVFPLFLKKCPHPVSFGALRFLSSCILPTRHDEWNEYTSRSEKIYQESKRKIEDKIVEIIEESVKLVENDMSMAEVKKDPWLRQLDWTISPLKLTKKGIPAKNQKFPGFPEWYRSLFPNKTATRPLITIKSRSIPIFFKLSWEGYPCTWTKSDGWCFPVPCDLIEKFRKKNYSLAQKETNDEYLTDLQNNDTLAYQNQVLFKIPHPNGAQFNCTTLLSKPYIPFFEQGILSSGSDLAHEALHMNSSGSYWMSSRERIVSQFVVPQTSFPSEFKSMDSCAAPVSDKESLGIILPAIIPMGTVTRRAVEKTWLTASNAKLNRIGSELKAQIKAPKGYCFVGADVDSEELWIASLVGDSVFNIHGGTPIGWMCLEGSKIEGTDLHTKTADILGCTRGEAKIFNYGRIYGAGVKFAAQLLKRFNHSLTAEEASKIARKLYESTKGKTKRSKIFKKFWYGGSESILFNKLESIAEQEEPRTPVLGCGITASLLKKNLGSNSFLPSRINWAIQSSGVDYLHLLTCSMHYLISKYHINARLCLSIHDEIRYLVSEEDKFRAAMALQVSSIWTRAIFCEQIGIDDLPQNCAFFSAVDIDHIIRKEVDMDCITPSNSKPISHGECLNINQLLDKPQSFLGKEDKMVDVSKFPSHYREPVFSEYNKAYRKEFLDFFLKMQIQDSKREVNALESEYIREKTTLKFKEDGIRPSFGLQDYLKDIENGKKERLGIMELIPLGNLNDGDFSIDEKLDGNSFNSTDAVCKSFHSSKISTSTRRPEINAKETSKSIDESSMIIEELHHTNTQLRSSDTTSDNGAIRLKRTRRKFRPAPADYQGPAGRRSRKVVGSQNAYDAFYASLDKGKDFASTKDESLFSIPIDEVVSDVLNDSNNANKPKNKSSHRKAKNASKAKLKGDNNDASENFNRKSVPVIGISNTRLEPQKMH